MSPGSPGLCPAQATAALGQLSHKQESTSCFGAASLQLTVPGVIFGGGEAPWLHRCWGRAQGQHRDRGQPGHRSPQGPSASSGTDSSGDNKIPRKTAELGSKRTKRSLWADFEEKTCKNKLRWTQGQLGRGYHHQCVPLPEAEEETPTDTITNLPAREPGH